MIDIADPIMIIPAGTDHLEQILALESAGFDRREQWSRSSWISQLAGDALPVLIACDDGDRVVGVITLRLAGETAELDRITVSPAVRRRGIGRRLVQAGLATARAAGATEMILEVATANRPAIRLYRELGFTELITRRNYYGPDRDACVMKLILSDEGGQR